MRDIWTLGDVVPLTFHVSDGCTPKNATTATLVITLPDGSSVTPILGNTTVGQYTYDFTPLQVGRYVAVFSTTGEFAGTEVDVFEVTNPTDAIVTLAQAKAYLGQTSWTDPQISNALEAERIAQARRCRIDNYGPDLREALLRRVAVNLAERAVPLHKFDVETATVAKVSSVDPVVRRLEGPYRRQAIR